MTSTSNYPFPPTKRNTDNRSNDNMNSLFNFNSNRLLDRMFRRADGVVWDLMTGRIGIQTTEGIVTLDGEGESARVNQNLFDDFGIALPAFAQSVPVADVKVGDIIYRGSSNNVAWVIELPTDTRNSFKLMKPTGETVGWTPPKVQMLGFESGVMVLRSLVSMLPTGEAGVNQLQNLLMPMMLLGDSNTVGSGTMDKIMPFLLMQMTNGGDASGMSNMMSMMLMMQLMKS